MVTLITIYLCLTHSTVSMLTYLYKIPEWLDNMYVPWGQHLLIFHTHMLVIVLMMYHKSCLDGLCQTARYGTKCMHIFLSNSNLVVLA